MCPLRGQICKRWSLTQRELPPETRRRRQIVWNIFVYCSERTFTVGAIEVSTMMLLTVEYGWQTELCGASFMAVGGSSIVATKTFWTREDKLFIGFILQKAGRLGSRSFGWPCFTRDGAFASHQTSYTKWLPLATHRPRMGQTRLASKPFKP